MSETTTDPLQRLDALIGRWKTEGWTAEAPGAPAARIDAVDTYKRMPGGALLHLVDARVGDQTVEGAEIIGYDPDRDAYVTRYFGSDGPAEYEARFGEDGGALAWPRPVFRDGRRFAPGCTESPPTARWMPSVPAGAAQRTCGG
jgi:Protein of unknown function (DUF1579)